MQLGRGGKRAKKPVGIAGAPLSACLVALLAFAAATIALGVPVAKAAGPPKVDATWVSDVTATSASLHAEVNPEGESTTYRFEYLTEAKYQANPAGERFAGAFRAPSFGEASLGSTETDQPALQHLVSLAPATTYRYRIVATNSAAPAGVEGETHAFTTQPNASFAPEECANAQLRFEDSSLSLPDCRAYELVSPADKNGGAIQGFGGNSGGGVLQAAEDGNAATFSSSASFAGGQGAPTASQYVSRRSEAGWVTENITQPTVSGAYPNASSGVPYQLFSTDLARGLLLNGRRCAGPCPRSYSLRESAGGALTPLPEAAAGMRLLSASPDLHHLVFESEGSLYEWSGAGLVPISLLPPTAGPGAAFQAASADGRFTFYTEGAHLYRYDSSAEAASDLTPAGGVVGVLGISADGSSVYYLTNAGLFLWTAPGATTEVAPGAPASFAGDYPPATGTARVTSDGTHLAFLSTASLTGYDNTDQLSGEPDSEVFLYDAGAGPEGTLTCVSCNPTNERPLGPSTIPGAIANGNLAEDPTATDLYKPRNLSTEGNRLFFDSRDQIVPQDASAAQDVYEWEARGVGSCQKPGGCLALISSGKSSESSSFVDASANGSDAFFLSGDSLVPWADPGSFDLYDARAGGGFPEPASVIPCDGDACQAVPSPPEDPAPGTLVPGSPNPPVSFPKQVCPKGKRRAGHGKAGCGKRHHRKHPTHHKRGGRR